ncbi:hypothetical protein RJG79_11015 [Mycoplasmatota bacterium WC44]
MSKRTRIKYRNENKGTLYTPNEITNESVKRNQMEFDNVMLLTTAMQNSYIYDDVEFGEESDFSTVIRNKTSKRKSDSKKNKKGK